MEIEKLFQQSEEEKVAVEKFIERLENPRFKKVMERMFEFSVEDANVVYEQARRVDEFLSYKVDAYLKRRGYKYATVEERNAIAKRIGLRMFRAQPTYTQIDDCSTKAEIICGIKNRLGNFI